jgi:hypothetical protein
MAEAWFGILTRKSVCRGSFVSVKDLVRHIGDYFDRVDQETRGDHPQGRPARSLT